MLLHAGDIGKRDIKKNNREDIPRSANLVITISTKVLILKSITRALGC